MKQKYVPIEKQSKRAQKAFHATQRKDWGGRRPVTQVVPNAKAYNRKKSKFRHDGGHEPNLDFFVAKIVWGADQKKFDEHVNRICARRVSLSPSLRT